jgi:hypothetical protein
VQRLLATKADKDIAAEDYLEIVQRIQGAFLDATRANLRVRALSSLGPNLRMIFSQRYSRSHRMGQLYEQYLYGNVPRPDGTTRPRTMQDLLVLPADEPESDVFKPKFSNCPRRSERRTHLCSSKRTHYLRSRLLGGARR